MEDLLTALGLVLVFEGAAYALLPGTMKRLMLRVLAEPASHLRNAGLAAAVLGVGLVWLARG